MIDDTETPVVVDGAEEVAPAPSETEAFDKGVTEADATPEEGAKPAEAEPVVEAAKEEPKEAAPVVEEEKQEPTVDDEIKSLGLKTNAAERFRELSKRPDLETFEAVQQKAARADQWESTVSATGTNPEQFQRTLALLSAINSGDPVRLKQGLEAMRSEVVRVAKQLGEEVPGLHDPLADHADLQQAVEQGAITKEYAVELSRQRAATGLMTQQTQRTNEAQEYRDAVNKAVNVDLAVLSNKLAAVDSQFETKVDLLQPLIQHIRDTLPPSKWAEAIEAAYKRLPSIPAPAPKPSRGVPVRPTGGNPNALARKPSNDMEAFELGLSQAR